MGLEAGRDRAEAAQPSPSSLPGSAQETTLEAETDLQVSRGEATAAAQLRGHHIHGTQGGYQRALRLTVFPQPLHLNTGKGQ